MTYSYFVTTDSTDFPTDTGEEQVTLMTQKVTSNTELTDEEVWENACASGDWNLYFGEGCESTVGSYQVVKM